VAGNTWPTDTPRSLDNQVTYQQTDLGFGSSGVESLLYQIHTIFVFTLFIMPQVGENGCPTVYPAHRTSKRPTGPQLGILRLLTTILQQFQLYLNAPYVHPRAISFRDASHISIGKNPMADAHAGDTITKFYKTTKHGKRC
jgi:hypothetical protein